MRFVQSRLTSRDVQALAVQLLQRHLALADYSAFCTAVVLYHVVLYAASCLSSILDACSSLLDVPCEQTLYDAFDDTLPGLDVLQRRLNRALLATLPRCFRKRQGRKRLPVAIDLNLQPYYGRYKHDSKEVYRAGKKAGTYDFHAYATAYVCYKGERFTLSCLFVPRHTSYVDVLKLLLRRVKQALHSFSFVLLDRGFWSAEVVRYMQRARRPFVMPAQYKGRKPSHRNGPSGTYVFRSWRRSGWTTYTIVGRKQKATVPLCVKVVYRGRARRRQAEKSNKKKGRKVLLYAVWGMKQHTPEWVRQTYRRRFGIESSYRQMNQCRVRTTTRCPRRRLFFVGVALLLRNLWVWLHRQVLSNKTRQGVQVCLERLRLRTMLRWIQRFLERLYKTCEDIDLRPPGPVPPPRRTATP